MLFLVSTSNYLDRSILPILFEPIKDEFEVSDTMLGVLSGFSFSLFYALFGMPVARWADRGNRRTIIALALAVWSAMTVLCGLAQSYWQLALARFGVGAGESGATPPSQSLIVDYFPPDQRATAISIFAAGSTAGTVLGMAVGGYVAATHGWRSAFIVAGVPGLALAVVVRLVLAEPRQQQAFGRSSTAAESMRETLAQLWRKRSFVYALGGMQLYYLFAYGGLVFIPSFLIRVLDVSLAEASVTYGVAVAVSSLVGTLGGGWLADRLGRRDGRWLAWLPAIACTLTGPLYLLAFLVDDFASFIVIGSVAYMLLMAGLPPVLAAIHAVCGSRRRAMTIALLLFSGALFGGGFGPLMTGVLSDALSAVHGAKGLRYALIATVPLLIGSGALLYQFGRLMPNDLED